MVSAITNYFYPENPLTQQREFRPLPTFVEKAIGWVAYPFALFEAGGVIKAENPKFGHYVKLVEDVGQKLAQQCPQKGFTYQFKVLNSHEDQSWCLPGGKIGISRGLIKHLENETSDFEIKDLTLEDKVAAVLSHEIIHAAASHSHRVIIWSTLIPTIISIANFALTLWVGYYYFGLTEVVLEFGLAAVVGVCSFIITSIELGYSRSYELEADRFSIKLMNDCGLKPQAAVFLMSYFNAYHDDTIGYPWFDRVVHFLSSHPTPADRLEANKKTLREMNISFS